MSSRRAAVKWAKDKRHPGGFVALPYAVIRSGQYASLSAHAVKLLIDLLAQYQGNNNGDLCATWNIMRVNGWRSRDTLCKALGELRVGGWIAQTRQGGLHVPTLYGVTFFALDPSSKLDSSSATFPRGAWFRVAPIVRPRTKRGGQHVNRVKSDVIDTPTVPVASAKSIN